MHSYDLKDLDWFFNQSEASMGIKSNFSSIIAFGLGGSSPSDNTTEDQLISLISKSPSPFKKYRKIQTKLSSLSKQDYRLLELYYSFYSSRPYQPELISKFGSLTPLILFLTNDHDHLIQIAKSNQKAPISDLKQKAKSLLQSLHKKYLAQNE